VLWVACTYPLGDQDLDRLTDQLVALVAEHAFALGVDQGDGAVAGDADYRVGGGFQQTAEHRLGALPFADVSGDRRHAGGLTVGAGDR
jgi:hypothetical protein